MRFDIDLLDPSDPFEIDRQIAHLSKHHGADVATIREVWEADPLFYEAKPPAHWIMTGDVEGQVWQVPLAPSRDGDPTRCRPIGCYAATGTDVENYLRDRRTR